MFTLIGAMAELESSLISERVTAGMMSAKARGKHLGRPSTPAFFLRVQVEELARTTNLSIRKIHAQLDGKVSRSVVGEMVRKVRNARASG